LRNKFGSLRSRRTLRKTISLSLRLLMPLIRAAEPALTMENRCG